MAHSRTIAAFCWHTIHRASCDSDHTSVQVTKPRNIFHFSFICFSRIIRIERIAMNENHNQNGLQHQPKRINQQQQQRPKLHFKRISCIYYRLAS